jgi:sugar (pentulose or hexulose) kinase
MLANVFGKRVAVLESEEGSAYGAALLALVGTGNFHLSWKSVSRVREVGFVDPQLEETAIAPATATTNPFTLNQRGSDQCSIFRSVNSQSGARIEKEH